MTDNNTSHLISELTRSYSLQLELYKKLHDNASKIYSQLVLSRGDLTRVMGQFSEKQRLLNALTAERERMQQQAQQWQQAKATVKPSDETEKLNAVLEKIEQAIKAYLDTEQQLERYLKHLAGTEQAAES